MGRRGYRVPCKVVVQAKKDKEWSARGPAKRAGKTCTVVASSTTCATCGTNGRSSGPDLALGNEEALVIGSYIDSASRGPEHHCLARQELWQESYFITDTEMALS
eukprot:4096576-Pleurochrysis_carterae.AAC.4